MRARLIALALLALPAPALGEPNLEGFWNLAFDSSTRDPALIAKLPPGTVVIEDTGVVEFPEDEYGGLRPTRGRRPTSSRSTASACRLRSFTPSRARSRSRCTRRPS